MADRLVAEVHITRRNSVQRTEIRTAVLGDHGCGKSTVLGCLTYGESDNGRGKARLNLLRHRHEVESGRTSSITFGTIGFDADRQLLNYTNNHSAELIFQRSRHVVTFIDTCGHSKHLKTTASAVAGYSPQVFCVVVAADAEEITATTRAYLAIAAVLKAPLMVVVTKMDIAVKSHFAVLMNGLLCALDAAVPGRSRCLVTDSSGCESLSCDMMSLKVVPIFTTSAVRTVGFNELTAVLSHARVPSSDADQPDRQPTGARGLFEFHIEHLFSIDAVGTVVTGWVKSGSAQVGSASGKQQLLVGPDDSGSFTEIKVTSIHALRIPTETAEARSSAALAIQPAKPMRIRKGMLVLDAELATGGGRRISNEFTARGAVLNAGLNGSSTVIVHVRSTYHQARVIELTEKPSTAVLDATLGPGNSPAGCAFATVRLRFSDDVHDYMYAGIPIVVRDGPNLAFVGHISDVL
ncbi:P-loop containing nucleoside triphosphate hydrolase protein [Martensiomyces pterosporus]|nr:P-loop containing nucleoside triphosphate hydrolase protein [Martensiomyces pterosporus]